MTDVLAYVLPPSTCTNNAGMSARKYHTREEKMEAMRLRARERYAREKDKILERNRRYFEENRDKVMAGRKRWAADPAVRARRQEEAKTRGERLRRSDAEHSRRMGKKYGVSATWFVEQLRAQEGRCAACRESEPNGCRLSVDHDHVTGKVRGLLCHACNTSLGLLRDSPQRILALHQYAVAHA